MKRILLLMILVLLVWVIELRDGRVYRGMEISAGRGWVTLITTEGEKLTFSWWELKSITNKEVDQ